MNHRYLLVLALAILNSPFSIAQGKIIESENIGDCFGAIQIALDEPIQTAFTGYAGTEDDLEKWKDTLSIETFNTLWLKFNSPVDGTFSINGELNITPLEILIFKLNKNETCSTIQNKKSNLVFNEKIANSSALKKEFKLKEGESLYLYFNTTQDTKKSLTLNAGFQIADKEGASASLMVKEDLRTDVTQPSFQIKVRDAKTKLPVESRIIISDSKNFNALYTASDMLFTRDGYLKFEMKVDAPGYFFEDIEVNIRNEATNERIIYLNPLEKNQEIELEGIQFLPQSTILTEESKPRLRRLRDFLALNSEVQIEIQGHVHHIGRNNWKSKRVSKKRAKKVRNYLIQNGVDGDRLSVKGFGNAKMKYPEPENDNQRSANRRVEIKIK